MPFNRNHIIKPAIVGAVFAAGVSFPCVVYRVPWREMPLVESFIAGVAFALAVRILLNANDRYKAQAPERAARAAAEAARRAAMTPEERAQEDEDRARLQVHLMMDTSRSATRFHASHTRVGRR